MLVSWAVMPKQSIFLEDVGATPKENLQVWTADIFLSVVLSVITANSE